MGRRGPGNVFEVDVDVGSSRAANTVVGLVCQPRPTQATPPKVAALAALELPQPHVWTPHRQSLLLRSSSLRTLAAVLNLNSLRNAYLS